MFKNYLLTAFRNLLKNPLTSFINIFGLSVAIGVCLVVYAFIEMDYSIDTFHENKETVYLSTYYVDREGESEQYGLSPAPLGDMLKEDFVHIQKVCRVKDRGVIIKNGDKVFQENIRYVDPEFLEMLTFPLAAGSATSLVDLNSIILSANMAEKYFGETDPVGKDLIIKFDSEKMKTFKVTGVAAEFPYAHAIHFDFLINFQNIKFSDPGFQLTNWKERVDATLVQVDEPAAIHAIGSNMHKYKEMQNLADSEWPISAFEFVQLKELHFASGNIRGDISHDNFYEGRMVLPIIAFLMIVLACFNYINIAIVSAAKRLKEIGLRKVIGASRGRVIIQFLSENVFITIFASLFGLFLAIVSFLPWFVNLSGMELSLNITDWRLWTFLITVLLFTGISSGIYPAFYISKFQVVSIFKGSVRFGKKNPLTKVFLGIQLVLACTGITGAIMFAQNSAYQSSRSWGYEQKGAFYLQLENPSDYEKMASLVEQNPNVISLAGSKHHLGVSSETKVLHLPERDYEVRQISTDANYFQTMGLELIQGRLFKENYQSDYQNIVVNEHLVQNLALDEPIGQVLKMDSSRYQIVGVVKDFYFNNFYYDQRPVVFTVAGENEYHFLSLRSRTGTEKGTYEDIKAAWAEVFPETPFSGGYQEDTWGTFYEDMVVMKKFMRIVAFIAVLLASLGLYGLVTLNVTGRVREFSIRKALGAGVGNIAGNIIRQYMLLTISAIVVGAPISYLLIQANLDMMFPHPMPTRFSGVTLAVILLVVVLITVISTQIRKVVKSNPVKGLRVE